MATPPRALSPQPFWVWNGVLTTAELRRQIDAMMAQGVCGAYVHCRSGPRPRDFTAAWWERVQAAAGHSAEVGFALRFVDELNWPSGEARDYTLSGYPTRVLDKDPGYRMKRLDWREEPLIAGAAWTAPEEATFVVVATRDAGGVLDGAGLARVEPGATVRPVAVAHVLTLVEAIGFDGGVAVLLDPAAVRAFSDAVYERYAEHLGTTVPAFFCDDEADYGKRLAWTGGTDLAERPWAPYVFDATGVARPGANRLEDEVRTSRAGVPGRGPVQMLFGDLVDDAEFLESVDAGGLYGPVAFHINDLEG